MVTFDTFGVPFYFVPFALCQQEKHFEFVSRGVTGVANWWLTFAF